LRLLIDNQAIVSARWQHALEKTPRRAWRPRAYVIERRIASGSGAVQLHVHHGDVHHLYVRAIDAPAAA
jgi:hypothetical protein